VIDAGAFGLDRYWAVLSCIFLEKIPCVFMSSDFLERKDINSTEFIEMFKQSSDL
jgi:hypothetical protein